MARAGVKQVMISAVPAMATKLHALIGDGQQMGLQVSYLLAEEGLPVEHALRQASQFFADSAVLLAEANLCCTNFELPHSVRTKATTVTCFRMQNAEKNQQSIYPGMLLLGNGALTRLRQSALQNRILASDVDELRRSSMGQIRHIDLDLRAHCVFAHLVDTATIDDAVLSNADLRQLVGTEPLVMT